MNSYYDFDKYELKSEFGGISQRSFPNKAADFLVENNVQGNFFNDFNSGAYLLGRTFPDIKVFIDGRTEVYGAAFFKEYKEIWENGNIELFEKAVEQHGITGAFMNSTRQHIPKKLLNYLYEHTEWHMVYFNYDAAIFLKDVGVNRALIDQFRIDLEHWEAPQVDLYKLGSLRVKPYQPYFRAYTLESLGLNTAAKKELNVAIQINPFYAQAYDLIGKIFAQQQDFQKAFEHFRLAVVTQPRNKEMRHNLALSYFDLNEYKGAIKQYEKIVTMWPKDPKGHFLLTKTLITDEQYPDALKSLRQAQKTSPEAVKEFLELGDLLLEKKAYHQAQETFMMALATGKSQGIVHEKLGKTALATIDRQLARKEFEKALSIKPDNEEIKKALQELR